MKIAITGASGHIGANLCPLLLAKGHTVRVLTNRSALDLTGVEVVQGHLSNPASLSQLVEGADAVVHLAAKISLDKDRSGELWDINVKGTQHVVDACIAHGVKKLIHFSSIQTFDPHPSNEPLNESRGQLTVGMDYDLSKIESEKIVRQAQEKGIITTVLYPTSVLGPNDYRPSLLGKAIIDMYKNKVPMLVPGGYDFVDVRDVATATYRVLTDDFPGEAFILGGHYLSIKELAQAIAQLDGRKKTPGVLPAGVLKALLPFFQLQSWLTKKPPHFTEGSLQALIDGPQVVSTKKAEELLGYQKTPTKKTIADTIEWFKANGSI